MTNLNFKNRFFSTLKSITFGQNFYQRFVGGMKTIFSIFSKNSAVDDQECTKIMFAEVEDAVKNNISAYPKLNEITNMTCHAKIKENMEEFEQEAGKFNIKYCHHIFPDLDKALIAINFSEISPENDKTAQELYVFVRNKINDVNHNDKNSSAKVKEQFDCIDEFRKSNKIYLENNISIKEHINNEEDFKKYLDSEEDVFFVYISGMVQTSLEFISRKERVLISSYKDRISKGGQVFDEPIVTISSPTSLKNKEIPSSINAPKHKEGENQELLEKIAQAKEEAGNLQARSEYARILLFMQEMILQEEETKHKTILTKKQIAIQRKNNTIERKEIQEINAQTRMIRAETFAIKAKEEEAKALIEKAKTDIAAVRVKAQEQKTLAAQKRAQEMSVKLDQERALEAIFRSRIEMKAIKETIKDMRAIGVIGSVIETGDSIGELMVN